MIKNLIVVGAGGMIGSMLRYYISWLIGQQTFPYATLLVNIAGSLVIGIIGGIALRNTYFDLNWRMFLATGICGGFTTFSAFSFECVHLFQQQRFYSALLYIMVSVTTGIPRLGDSLLLASIVVIIQCLVITIF